jgi:hypothetical protein
VREFTGLTILGAKDTRRLLTPYTCGKIEINRDDQVYDGIAQMLY